MERRYDAAQFDQVLQGLTGRFRIMGPTVFPGQSEMVGVDYVGYGEVASLRDLAVDRKTWFSPKECLFPVRETLFTFDGAAAEVPQVDERPLILFLRACDVNGIKRLDKIFLDNGPNRDFYYERRRRLCRFFLIECRESFDTCFCASMGANTTDDFSAAFRFSEGGVTALVRDREFADAFEKLGETCVFTPGFVDGNQLHVNIPPPDRITPAHFDHPLWTEYTRRCIACGRCNTSCPTCTCFAMQDTPAGDDGAPAQRRRRWAGCHVQGFTDMAGGHSFRAKNGERMRFKTMHKINDFHRRFGSHMCVGCGRCDDVCPEHISFAHCVDKLAEIVGTGERP